VPTDRTKRPRRKAKQERSRETVDIILEASARVLAEHGYAAASTNRIAEHAGVSVGTLYEYFANKEELFEALIRRELGALVAAMRNLELDADAPVHESITRILLASMSAVRHGPELFRSLEQVPGASFRRQLAEARAVVIALVTELLQQHRSELRVTDPALAAFIVVSAAEGIGANARRDFFDEKLGREIATLLRLYLTGEDAGDALAR
jgi:AcrR family transcriptional regulator